MCIHRYKTLARFGLMHMVATNICVWLENIVTETVREVQKSTQRNTQEGNLSKNSEYRNIDKSNSLQINKLENNLFNTLFKIILYSILCGWLNELGNWIS